MTICINAFMLSGIYTINRDGDDELIEEMKNKLVGKITLELDPALIMKENPRTQPTIQSKAVYTKYSACL